MKHPLFIILISVLTGFSGIHAASFEFHGQASGWLTMNLKQIDESQAGLRYLPALSFDRFINQNLQWTSTITWNFNGTCQNRPDDTVLWNHRSKPYRLWMRLATPQFEARIGLQKINFGSAVMFRSLMWFDQIDPRDPLQITDGVYALLLRYTFINNTNLWFWSLYGNDNPRGWDVLGSDPDEIEFGGRIQVPLPCGEAALSYHRRYADPASLTGKLPVSMDTYLEQKMGFDFRWDWIIGLWLETSLNHQDIPIPDLAWQRLTTAGLDYTFNVGNGLYAITEYLNWVTSDAPFSKTEGFDFSAVSFNYPLGLLDAVTGMVYYDWDSKEWYRFINFQRSLDQWQFFLMGFWNPDQLQIYGLNETTLFAGKGFQFMVVFNH